MLHGDGYQVIGYRLYRNSGSGICYMHTVNPASDTEETYHIGGDSWCPDYTNRERTNKSDKMTLDEWLESIKNRK